MALLGLIGVTPKQSHLAEPADRGRWIRVLAASDFARVAGPTLPPGAFTGEWAWAASWLAGRGVPDPRCDRDVVLAALCRHDPARVITFGPWAFRMTIRLTTRPVLGLPFPARWCHWSPEIAGVVSAWLADPLPRRLRVALRRKVSDRLDVRPARHEPRTTPAGLYGSAYRLPSPEDYLRVRSARRDPENSA